MQQCLWIIATVAFASSALLADQITINSLSKVKNHNPICKVATAEGDEFIPNDALFDQQWGMRDREGEFGIGATSAWAIERGNRSIAIVVIDSGIDYTHPDLVNNMWTNPNEIPGNNIDDDHNGYIDDIHGVNVITGSGDPMDDHGHGTFLAGAIGAEGNNGIGIAGVMHNVSLIGCKFLNNYGSGSTEGAIKCLNYVADLATRGDIGVTIVATNNAWGGGGADTALFDAIKRHNDLGILFVTAAGGSGLNIDENKTYPASYELPNIMVTAKADNLGNITWGSNYGPRTVHLAAPGQDILSTIPGGEYDAWSGTVATGFLSGTIGLIKAHNNQLSGSEIKNLIMAKVTTLPSVEDQNKVISNGRLNAYASLWH